MTSSETIPDICVDALADTMRPDLFKALCDPMRISIVATLASRAEPSTVSDIADCCGIDFSGVSRHLKILKEAGAVSADRSGRSVFYSLDADMLATTLRGIADALEVCRNQVA